VEACGRGGIVFGGCKFLEMIMDCIWGFDVFKETVHARLQCFGWISIRGGHAFRVGLNKFWLMQIPEIDSGRIGGFEISKETLQARIQCLRIFLIRGVHACSVEF
jgi:hypothetical protein